MTSYFLYKVKLTDLVTSVFWGPIQYRGQRIFGRLGRFSQEKAEAWIRITQAEVDAKRENTV